jgi:hypothetical protein
MTDTTDPTNPGPHIVRNARGHFQKGSVANPKGKPKGRTAACLLRDKLGKADADALLHKAKSMALAGNPTCQTGLLRLMYPVPREKAMNAPVELPPLVDVDSAVAAIQRIAEATALGLVDADQRKALISVVSAFTATLQVSDLDSRLQALEERK